MFSKSILAATAAIAMAGSAQAALIAVNSEASFLAQLLAGSKAVETLESFLPGDSAGATGLNLQFGGSTTVAKLLGPDAIFASKDEFGNPIDNAGREAHSGINFWQGGSQPFELVFTQAIQAFGFWGSDIGDFAADCPVGETCSAAPGGGVLTIEFFTKSSDTVAAQSITVSGSTADASQLFWGFFDKSGATYEMLRFTNLTLTGNNVADFQGFDDFTIGAVQVDTNPPSVPEPGMLALAGIGLMAMARRRRR